MKVLIFQVMIGDGGYGYGDNLSQHFEKHLMPSVRRYCKKHGYNYKLITEPPKDIDISWFNNKNEEKDRSSTLIRYLNMDQPDYDMVVSLDCDIFIPEHAEKIPVIKGHGAVKDKGGKDRSFINGGVQIMDSETGTIFCNHMRNQIKNKKKVKRQKSDQQYPREWRKRNSKLAVVLDFKWNYMVAHLSKGNINYNNACFIHYAGKLGREVFKRDLERGYFGSN